tara:strand:+ start:60 stop:299 length:240 start_codon:yes stop_codon:yes gene_type:complete
MSIVFVPKIGDHLRKTEGLRVDTFSKEDMQEVVRLRAAGYTYRECSRELSRAIGSIASVINYYNLQGAIDEAKKLLEKV